MTVNRSLLKNLIESAKDIALAAPAAAPITQGQLMAWPRGLIPANT